MANKHTGTTERVFHEDWTRDDCVEYLQEFAERHSDQAALTVRFFRDESMVLDRTWSRYFSMWTDYKKAAGLYDRFEPNDVPLSEKVEEFKEDWSPEDCLECLRAFAEEHKDQVISRNFFRVHGGISESTWNRYFGSFLEFKRQAGLILSRHAHRLERDIAKHASADNARAVGHDKALWEGRFLRPSNKRFQSALVLADVHDIMCDPFYRRTVIDVAQRLQPEKIIYNGDLFDLPEFSKHTQDPREFLLVERMRWVHKFLKDLREAAPGAENTLVEGNHEFRLLRHLSEQTMAIRTLLSEMHGMTVSSLLGLDKFEVNLVARADLAAWTERDITKQLRRNYTIAWDTLLFGHYPDMRHMGMPGGNGHHHRHIVWQEFSPQRGPYEWHQSGCGHVREASYTRGDAWSNGFLMAHCDTWSKSSQIEYADLSHDHAYVGGKLYLREEAEGQPGSEVS